MVATRSAVPSFICGPGGMSRSRQSSSARQIALDSSPRAFENSLVNNIDGRPLVEELVRRAIRHALAARLERLLAELEQLRLNILVQEFVDWELRTFGHSIGVQHAVWALQEGDRITLEAFFTRVLRFRTVTPDRLEAFHRVTTASSRWRALRDEGVYGYVYVATAREGRRLRRDREMHDRLWWGRRGVRPVSLEGASLDSHLSPEYKQLDDPEAVLLRKEEQDVARLAIERLRSRGLPPDQAQLLDLLEEGLTPAEAIRATRMRWSTFQALQRKARRHFA
jgi:hypothetical protein